MVEPNLIELEAKGAGSTSETCCTMFTLLLLFTSYDPGPGVVVKVGAACCVVVSTSYGLLAMLPKFCIVDPVFLPSCLAW